MPRSTKRQEAERMKVMQLARNPAIYTGKTVTCSWETGAGRGCHPPDRSLEQGQTGMNTCNNQKKQQNIP